MLTDCSALTESLSGHHLLEDAALSETVRNLAVRFDDPQQLADELVRRGWLTAFQKELILAGRAAELVLGPYVLVEKIGEGGMGAVYKARHRVLKAVRAIKVIRPDRLSGSMAVDRFYREAEVVAKLHHPNIILAHDAGQHGTVHYFVMEFAPGADLGQLLQRCGPLPAADACSYIRQAALGLEHAREHNLIHRDIKPSNLLVTPDGHVKLLDLGLARIRTTENETPSADSLTQDGAVMGTPDYMAPEQAEDSRRVDIRADIYSLGCTLYHILTGRAPFAGGSVMDKLIKHRLEEPRPIEMLRGDLPAGLAAVIRKMMAKDPAARYQTPAEVVAALQPFCVGASPRSVAFTEELPGTLMPGMVPSLTEAMAANPTLIPGGALEPTQPVHRQTTAPAFPVGTNFGPTELLPESKGLQPTQMQVGAATSLPQTEMSAPPRKRRGMLIAILCLVGLGVGAVGVYSFMPLFVPPRTKPTDQHVELPPPPQQPTVNPKGSGNENSIIDKPKERPVKPPPVVDQQPIRLGEVMAKNMAGDRTDLALTRSRGPAVRTGSRELSWARRRELYTLAPHKGVRATFSSDKGRAIFSTQTDAVLVFGLRDIQPPYTASLSELAGNLTDSSARINAITLTPDGSRALLATVGRSEKPRDGNPITTKYNMLISWELSNATELIYGPRLDVTAGFGCLAYAPDGKEVLVAGALPQIYRWKPGSRDLSSVRRYFKHGNGDVVVNALSYSADGRLVVSSGTDKLVCIFDDTKATSDPLTTLSGLHGTGLCAAISASGRYVLAGSREGKICLWDVGDEPTPVIPKPTGILNWHDKDSSVTAVAFAPTGRHFLTGSDDGTVCLGEVGVQEPLWRETPRIGGGAILALAFTTDGRHILVADETGLSQYPVVQDVTAKSKSDGISPDAEIVPAEGKGR